VTNVIFLQASGFGGEWAGAGNYEGSHKGVFGLSVVLELKVQNSVILTFKVIFLCQKLTESFSIFLSLMNIKKGDQLLLITYFD